MLDPDYFEQHTQNLQPFSIMQGNSSSEPVLSAYVEDCVGYYARRDNRKTTYVIINETTNKLILYYTID